MTSTATLVCGSQYRSFPLILSFGKVEGNLFCFHVSILIKSPGGLIVLKNHLVSSEIHRSNYLRSKAIG